MGPGGDISWAELCFLIFGALFSIFTIAYLRKSGEKMIITFVKPNRRGVAKYVFACKCK